MADYQEILRYNQPRIIRHVFTWPIIDDDYNMA